MTKKLCRMAAGRGSWRIRQFNNKNQEHEIMKKYLQSALVFGGLALALQTSALSDDKPKSITGEAICTKSELKETKSCMTAIKVTEGGKPVTYYLVQNEVSKKFHDNICQKPAKVKATGAVNQIDGKLELTATSIELVKD